MSSEANAVLLEVMEVVIGSCVTCRVAAVVIDPMAAVTVWAPTVLDEHVAPVHEPLSMVKVACAVRPPRSLPAASRPATV